MNIGLLEESSLSAVMSELGRIRACTRLNLTPQSNYSRSLEGPASRIGRKGISVQLCTFPPSSAEDKNSPAKCRGRITERPTAALRPPIGGHGPPEWVAWHGNLRLHLNFANLESSTDCFLDGIPGQVME